MTASLNRTLQILGLLILIIIVGIGAASVSQMLAQNKINALAATIKKNQEEMAKLQGEKTAAIAEAKAADERSKAWEQQAREAHAAIAKLQVQMQGIEARLAALGPVKPVTDVTTMPIEIPQLVTAFHSQGIEAIPDGPQVALPPAQAQKTLALVVDGRNYPTALARGQVLEEKVGNLQGQLAASQSESTNLGKALSESRGALESERQARAASEAQLTDAQSIIKGQEGVISEKDKQIHAEKRKTLLVGGGGVVLAILVALL